MKTKMWPPAPWNHAGWESYHPRCVACGKHLSPTGQGNVWTWACRAAACAWQLIPQRSSHG